MGPGYWSGEGFGFMWIFPVLFFIIFLFFIRSIFGPGGGRRNNSPHMESAREILDKRYANGEINKDEYEEMKKTLGNNNR